MIITEDVVIILDGKYHQFSAGDKILFSETDGKSVSKDIEVMLDGERYFLEKGDKVILTEDLYGFKIVRGPNPIDMLISHVDVNMIDWDVTDTKFQALANQILGNVPQDSNEWTQLISSSAQPPALKRHLILVSSSQVGASAHGDLEDGSPSDSPSDGASPSDASPSDPLTVSPRPPVPGVQESASSSPSDGSPSDTPTPKKSKKIDVEGPLNVKSKEKKHKKRKSSSGSPSDGSPSD